MKIDLTPPNIDGIRAFLYFTIEIAFLSFAGALIMAMVPDRFFSDARLIDATAIGFYCGVRVNLRITR